MPPPSRCSWPPTAESPLVASSVLVVQTPASRRVYDGDSPSPFRTAWLDLAVAVQDALDEAQTDPDGAQQLLPLLIMGRHRREVHEREIAFLRQNGVPAGFLADAAELDQLFSVGLPY